MTHLSVRGLSKSFGALSVIDKFDLELPQGSRHALIGPNGAGKTTLFNMLSGWLTPDSGTVCIGGSSIIGISPQNVTRAGMARSFQKNALFDELTVGESLWLAINARKSRGHLEGTESETLHDVARQMELEAVLDTHTNTLSYGQKRQLEVALSLACGPDILLLDEPASGTSPAERAKLVRLLSSLPEHLTLLLVEHDMDVVFGVCDGITVLNYGCIVASGSPDEIKRDPAVRAAYLGRDYA